MPTIETVANKPRRGRQPLSQQAFLAAAMQRHGSRYDYSQTIYTGSHNRIIIVCPVHGAFEQKAFAHLQYGCRPCGNAASTIKRRGTVTDFIERAGSIHDFKYDYRHVAFTTQHQKIQILCPKHGAYLQAANDHLKGHGCAKCGKTVLAALFRGQTTITTDRFIERAKDRHGATYDYRVTNYVGAAQQLEISCPVHGSFKIYPQHHLAGYGCPHCQRATRREHAYRVFLARAAAVHGSTYDYINYQGMADKVGIVCEKHGLFYQPAMDHLNGCACPVCARIERGETARYAMEEFVTLLAEKFDDHVTLTGDYNGLEAPSRFHCLAHGDFAGSPAAVLHSKHGCRRCSDYQGGLAIRLTGEAFLARASAIHAGTYRYGPFTRTTDPVDIECPRHGWFTQTAANHLTGYGCPGCGQHRAVMLNAWLDRMGVAEREVRIIIDGACDKVDGFDPATNTVFEFYGDFWHGNPRLYDPIAVNTACGVTFAALHARTRHRAGKIVQAGYKLVEIWEHDWKRIK